MLQIITLPKRGWRAEHSFVIISIVIPTLGRTSLQRTLDSIKSLSDGDRFEIIVCADTCADRSNLQRLTLPNNAKVVLSPASGVNRARNEGVRHCLGNVIWFLDDDTEIFEANAFESLIALFSEPSIVAAGGEYVSDRRSSILENGYNSFCSVWRSSAGTENRESLLGGTLAVRKSAFEKVGGFDETIDYGGAETSFVHRLNMGAEVHEKIVFDRRLDVLHRPAARSLSRWMKVAIAQSAQKQKQLKQDGQGLPLFSNRVERALRVIRRQDMRSRLSLIVFGVPFIAVSQFVARARR